MTFTFPNGTTSCEFGAVMGATEKPRSAVAWCRAKWMRIAPLLHSTEQTKDAERWRPSAGDKLLEVKSLAFKPGHLDVGRWRERKIGVDHCRHLRGTKNKMNFIYSIYMLNHILMHPLQGNPTEPKQWPHTNDVQKNTYIKHQCKKPLMLILLQFPPVICKGFPNGPVGAGISIST